MTVRDINCSTEPPDEAREDGPHAAAQPREAPEGRLPPHCAMYFGVPQQGSPFVQAHLPAGFRHEGKKSRSMCFKAEAGPPGGTSRTKEAATRSVVAWCWALDQKAQFSGETPAEGAPHKRQRVV